jgi:uncharacterized protein YndB with AHSA1/START domain
MAETVNNTTVIKDKANKSLIMERVLEAPRQRVWQAWTDPELFSKWWGPYGWQTTVKDADFRPGGQMIYGMKCIDESQGEWFGQESWGKMEFAAVDEPASFTYRDLFCDENGTVNQEMPVMTITVEFIEQDGSTLVRSSGVFDSQEGYDKVIAMGVVDGATQTWERLAELLQTQ